jgi:hypothetical protein
LHCGCPQEDVELSKQVAAPLTGAVRVLHVPKDGSLLELWSDACQGHRPDHLRDAILLLPDGYSLFPGEGILQACGHRA